MKRLLLLYTIFTIGSMQAAATSNAPSSQDRSTILTHVNLSMALSPDEKSLFKQAVYDAKTQRDINRLKDLVIAFEDVNKFAAGNKSLKDNFWKAKNKSEFEEAKRVYAESGNIENYREYIINKVSTLPADNPEKLLEKLNKIEQVLTPLYR